MSLASSEFAYGASALHPRLSEPALLARLTEDWRVHSRVRVQPFLAPGLAAELSAFVPNLQLTPQLDPIRGELSWRCLVRMPDTLEPQYPACMYRLGSALAADVPDLVTRITGRQVGAQEPVHIDVHVFRKGSYIDGVEPRSEPGSKIGYAIGLTAAQWPESWGGHLRLGDWQQPLSWDSLDLFADASIELPLITHHVRGTAVMGHLPVRSVTD